MTNKQNATIDTVVVGLGLTGLSCARYLDRQGVNFAITDSRDLPPGLKEAKLAFPRSVISCGELDRDLILSAQTCVVSPGVSINTDLLQEAHEKGVELIGDIELFARTVAEPVVAITGANGKSTVTTLVYEMAKADGVAVKAGGNLGTPALDLLNGEEADLYVLELSSFQLETTFSLDAIAATVLNISEDHMDRYVDLQAYADAKARIFEGDGLMVINADDPRVLAMQSSTRDVEKFSLKADSGDARYHVQEVNGEDVLMRGEEQVLPVNQMKIQGRHNVANALAAIALADAAGVSNQAIVETLTSWPGLPHRCEWVAEQAGIVWYNDSKGTNEGATVAAIEGFADRGPIVLIAGGDAKGATFEELAVAAKGRVKQAIVIGRDAPLLENILSPICIVSRADDMHVAVKQAALIAEKGDLVLMSPACASLDMYPNYLARGEDFCLAVRNLISEVQA